MTCTMSVSKQVIYLYLPGKPFLQTCLEHSGGGGWGVWVGVSGGGEEAYYTKIVHML